MFPSHDAPHKNYKFYYDESNNHRAFKLHSSEDAYNIDKDKQRKTPAPTNFMLAGVAYRCMPGIPSQKELMLKIGLSEDEKEIKFGKLASGDFWACLKSEKLRKFLGWLCESNLFIHTSHFNLEYWSFLDIIQDCIEHALNLDRIVFHDGEHRQRNDAELKDALHDLVLNRKQEFIAIVKSHDYPKIDGHEAALVAEIKALVESRMEDECIDKRVSENLKKLKLLLARCGDIEDMLLTRNSTPGLLVDDFSSFYIYRLSSFPFSEHIFDNEETIKDAISGFAMRNVPPVTASFVDSKESILNQVSDVVAGLFAKYFEMLNLASYEEVESKLASLNKFQEECFSAIRKLVEKSDSECEFLLHYVLPQSEIIKHRKLMFDIDA
ncbi:DUF3800 domain-containing protein [Pseudomonas aeruginosa]|uniref:DUF3800 domain-containing protein n=1 Tax=Pseudomonas aeruginosa TaxID=287 RepID=UPI00106D02D3|nr:DUF3800 domain-containing protein [Pseudomonas aeruginosa]MCO3670875.1 hypothetical protein [Pseudomonas aeruginosa]HBO9019090.1 DUF3800 domain-containing protein [Pseudomonas aeruginosa]HEH9487695.1 DUF3800 domain-containing protein [Pseudomonas aeruginosa]